MLCFVFPRAKEAGGDLIEIFKIRSIDRLETFFFPTAVSIGGNFKGDLREKFILRWLISEICRGGSGVRYDQ